MDDIRLHELLEKDLEDRLTVSEKDELFRELRASGRARQAYWDVVEQDILTGAVLSENRGRDLAGLEADVPTMGATAAKHRRPRGWAWTIALAAAATCALAALFWGGRLPEPVPLATVLAVGGDVDVRDMSGKSRPVELGSSLFVGQVLRVGDEESRVEVLFTDGTHFTLQSGSTVRLASPESKQGKHIHLETGAVQVQTAGKTSEGPLVVTTDHARITSSATRLRVYREEKGSRVELEEGQAHLESQNGAKAIDVAEGSFVLATADREPMVPQPLAENQCRLRHTFVRAGDAVAFSRDGSRIVTSHFGRSGFKAWNTLDGANVATAQGSRLRTQSMEFTTDDTVIAICEGGTAAFWKIGEPQPVLARLRDKDLRPGAVSADGRWIAQASRSEVTIWDIDADHGSISHRHSLPARASRVSVSSAGPQAAFSYWGGEIFLFDVSTGRHVAKHKLSRTPMPLALSADNRFVAAYATNDGLILFDEVAAAQRTLWAGQGARVSHLTFTSDGQILLAGLEDGTVRAWNTADGRSLFVVETGYRSGNVSQVTMSADRSLLATVGDNDCVKIWERPSR